MAVVRTFLIGCAFLLVVGCAGTPSETSKKEQGHSPEATASEEARCEGTRTIEREGTSFVTNDVPGCPKGGLLLGTDKPDKLYGGEGDDEIHGLGAADQIIYGGPGNDVIYGGPGNDFNVTGDDGDDVIYGGDGNDFIFENRDGGHNKIYCGNGKDKYLYAANKNDFVSSSCEKKAKMKPPSAGGTGVA